MDGTKIVNLFDLSHSLAGDYLSGFVYPWRLLESVSLS